MAGTGWIIRDRGNARWFGPREISPASIDAVDGMGVDPDFVDVVVGAPGHRRLPPAVLAALRTTFAASPEAIRGQLRVSYFPLVAADRDALNTLLRECGATVGIEHAVELQAIEPIDWWLRPGDTAMAWRLDPSGFGRRHLTRPGCWRGRACPIGCGPGSWRRPAHEARWTQYAS